MKANDKRTLYYILNSSCIAGWHSVVVCCVAGRCHMLLVLESAAVPRQGRILCGNFIGPCREIIVSLSPHPVGKAFPELLLIQNLKCSRTLQQSWCSPTHGLNSGYPVEGSL